MSNHFVPFAFSQVIGSNNCFIHFIPCSLLVHPFVLQERCQSSGTFATIQSLHKFAPLKIIKGGMKVPSAQTHSITITHSCRPGSASFRLTSTITRVTLFLPT